MMWNAPKDQQTVEFAVTSEGDVGFAFPPRPDDSVLRFAGPEGGWPPHPEGDGRYARVEASRSSRTLTQELAQEVRAIVLSDDEVASHLGDRYSHILTDFADSLENGNDDPAKGVSFRLLFFSHSRVCAVEVVTGGRRVTSVTDLRGFQPPEGASEIREAIEIARADDRLRDRVALLDATAILLPHSEEETGSAYRVMWVTFSDSASDEIEPPALYTAIVDVVHSNVIAVRQEVQLADRDHSTRRDEVTDGA
jgi:hypothetical protein